MSDNNLTTNFNNNINCQTTIPNGVVVLTTTPTTNGVVPILTTTASPPPQQSSPPKAVVDTSPLQNAMDKNKESLKVKLMLRRPINQLVAQGIMPPLKTPPAFHEQRRQLERAKTGDMLKAKIQQRPARIELERLHILECSSAPIDPSLAERQRMLKKARLADQLNDQLSHRPGPLELIQKNILHTEEPIEEAVKTGKIEFSATCEGLSKPQHPTTYITTEDDSQSSESDVIEHKNIVVTFAELCQSVTAGLPPPQASPAPGKSRKKSKMKSQPKTRTIKFHEYKGPPNAQKNLLNGNNAGKTSYQILLEQQQLFLQWQLEWQHKYPQIILPATQKIESPVGSPTSSVTSSVDSKTRLEDMKVSDLKMELKRRNLPVSGSKPQLIERLKPFTEPVTHSGHIIMDTPRPTTDESSSTIIDTDDNKSSVASPVSSDPDLTSPVTNDDIVREQQRKIEELQRELTRSQLQLQQVRSGVGQKIALQQHVQARQALRQQQQQVVAAFQKNVNGLLLNGLVLNQLIVPTIITQPTPPPPVIPEPPPRPPTPEPIKSQIVDDVLEILIKNGELPPSAANAPITPDQMQIEEPVVSAAISEQMNQELTEAITKQRELDFPNDLKDLALELETLGDFSMELDEEQPIKVEETMEMDESDWLDSLMSSHEQEQKNNQKVEDEELDSINSYDPLLVGNSFHDFELFGLEEFRNQNIDLGMNVPITWDKLDFAA